MTLSTCRCRAQVWNRHCHTVDERKAMALSVCRCRLQVCDIWCISTCTTSVRKRIAGWTREKGSNCVCCVFLYFLSLVGCWVLVIGCLCWLSVVSVGVYRWSVRCQLSNVECGMKIVGFRCRCYKVVAVGCWLLTSVAVIAKFVFPLSVPTSAVGM